MRKLLFLISICTISCNSLEQDDNKSQSNKIDSLTNQEQAKTTSERKLYLNGIYEYDYPNDSKVLNENQYIAFQKNGGIIQGWFYGTTDEFDEAREGYLPGFFVTEINNLKTNGDSLYFSISTGFNQSYSSRFPIGFIDTAILNEQFEKMFPDGEYKTINYTGKQDGLKLFINKDGETRTFHKTKNYFHPGIDNYDSTKCQNAPLITINKNIDNLNKRMIYEFLSTFSVICEANVEFGEWSNELLFKTLLKNPKLVLDVIADNSNKLDTTIIFKELEAPLHDLIPVDSIISRIKLLDIDEQIKTSVIKRLTPEK